MFVFSEPILAGIDFPRLLSCGLCSIDVSIVKIIPHSVSSEIKSIYSSWISVIGPESIMVSPTLEGRLDCTLRGSQAFTEVGASIKF